MVRAMSALPPMTDVGRHTAIYEYARSNFDLVARTGDLTKAALSILKQCEAAVRQRPFSPTGEGEPKPQNVC